MTRSRGEVTPGMASGTVLGGMSVLCESLLTHEALPVAKTPPPFGTVYQVTSE
jgi:hypothetical protein